MLRLTAEQVVLRSEPEEQGVLAALRREAQRVSAVQPQAVREELVALDAEVLQQVAREAASDAGA